MQLPMLHWLCPVKGHRLPELVSPLEQWGQYMTPQRTSTAWQESIVQGFNALRVVHAQHYGHINCTVGK